MRKNTPTNGNLHFTKIIPLVLGIAICIFFSLSTFAADSGTKDSTQPSIDISSPSLVCYEQKLTIFDRLSGIVRFFSKKTDNNSDLMNICNIKIKLIPFNS